MAGIIRSVAREEILTRFRALMPDQIRNKETATDPADVVTDADLAAEARLASALRALLPGAVVVGEEAAAQDPGVLQALTGPDPVWLIDPLDGTRNFVAGSCDFGTMVALVHNGAVRSSWIYLPATDQLYEAHAGEGAWVDGRPLRVPPRTGAPRGSLYTRFMPPELRAAIEARAAEITTLPGTGAACIEYTAVAGGLKDFVVYHRLLCWDHAPGSLLLAEAGGACRHPDGSAYAVTDTDGLMLLMGDPALWSGLARRLFEPR